MSYQVLARKWRPAKFQEMVGQEHVLKALVNALDDDRLHHAYLFTGTRGVGKTSIARLFAKSLNCETGVSSTPCGVCSACQEIAEGRFVDLIEVDAASRTKVEDTRELLENVQYAPTRGRYKVYLIDEVHMLSTHSFNALLKTLEEPPPHVKFLLATTDPQKLPITILSRCLQFNLKNLIPERIVTHLSHVLTAETIAFEESALWLLARSADGSMRDALSLTDQAISFGAGAINEVDVCAMLGTIDQRLVYQILYALAAGDAKAVLNQVTELAQFSQDYVLVLGDLISILHRIAIAQALPDMVDNSMGDQEQISELAGALNAEDVQLYYQIALMGRKDMPYVPDPKEGLEMALLRMLAFRPAGAKPRTTNLQTGSISSVTTPVAEPKAAPEVIEVTEVNETLEAPEVADISVEITPEPHRAEVTVTEPSAPQNPELSAISDAEIPCGPNPEPAAALEVEIPSGQNSEPTSVLDAEVPSEKKPEAPQQEVDAPPWDSADLQSTPWDAPLEEIEIEEAAASEYEPFAFEAESPSSQEFSALSPLESMKPVESLELLAPIEATETLESVAVSATSSSKIKVAIEPVPRDIAQLEVQHWVHLSRSIGLSGMTESLAMNLSLEALTSEAVTLHYDESQTALMDATQQQRISVAINDYLSAPVRVEFVRAARQQETPAQYMAKKREERRAEALAALREDAQVQSLQKVFDAQIELASVTPIDN